MKTSYFAPWLLASALSAAPLVNDSFDYTAGQQLDDQNASWTPDNDGTGVQVISSAFAGTATPIAQTGNSIHLTSGRSVHIDLSTAGDTDYFFSYSVNPGTFDGVDGRDKGLFIENGSSDLFAGFDENGNFLAMSHTSPVDSGIDAVAGTEYFILGKASFSSDLRTYNISTSVYSSAASVPLSEPGAWDATDSFTYGVAQSGLTEFRFNSRGATSQFDDARFSADFADVVPEPSSYGFILGFLAMSFTSFGRRR